MRKIELTLLAVMLLAAVYSPAVAASTQLYEAFEQIHTPAVDTTASYRLVDVRIDHCDFSLLLDSGVFFPYEPVLIDTDSIRYGGLFVGRGRLKFHPAINMEQIQLQRFYKTDSLDRYFDDCEIHLSDSMLQVLLAQSVPGETADAASAVASCELLRTKVTHQEEFHFTYKTLHNLDVGTSEYFHVNVAPDGTSQLLYYYDPLDREEISLYSHFEHLTTSFFEHLVSYPAGVDSALFNLNGRLKEYLVVEHVSTDGRITDDGEYYGSSLHTVRADKLPSRVLFFELHQALRVSQVLGPDSTALSFVRWNDWNNRAQPLYVFLETTPQPGERFDLSFHYNGYICEKGRVELRVSSGADVEQRKFDVQYIPFDDFSVTAENVWYPRYSSIEQPTYDMTFSSPENCILIASGNKVREIREGGRLITRWEVDRPTRNVTFNLGHLTLHSYVAADVGTVDVYYSDHLHTTLAPALSHAGMQTGRHMEQQVASDVENAVKLFNHYFGPYEGERIVVSELAGNLSHSGSAYPGFVNLGFNTFISTDAYGWDRLLRSHEVAHQWWGIGVVPETYRDRWLSEGFSEYSAVMYLQATEGNDLMIDRLRDYRRDIFSARSYLLGSGASAGIIALGDRTATSKSRDDVNLVLYKKGAFVLHMLRQMMLDLRSFNEDRFLNMMRDFYAIFRGRTASTLDFRRITEKHMGEDMGWFFDQWVYDNVMPTFHFSYTSGSDSADTWQVEAKIRTDGVDDDFFMYVPLEIEFENEQKAYIRIAVEGRESSFTLPQLGRKPKKLRLNPWESVLAEVKQ